MAKTFRALPALFTPVILLGGIYTGIVTPTEAGALAGLSVLLKSSAYLLLGALILLVLFAHRRSPRQALARAALCLAGFAVVFSPLVARNIAVGVSPFSTAASGPATFINHNAADYEAMAAERPMVISDISVFQEITQGEGAYFDHDNPDVLFRVRVH